jgi:hypothetical protein
MRTYLQEPESPVDYCDLTMPDLLGAYKAALHDGAWEAMERQRRKRKQEPLSHFAGGSGHGVSGGCRLQETAIGSSVTSLCASDSLHLMAFCTGVAHISCALRRFSCLRTERVSFSAIMLSKSCRTWQKLCCKCKELRVHVCGLHLSSHCFMSKSCLARYRGRGAGVVPRHGGSTLDSPRPVRHWRSLLHATIW